MLVKHGWPAVFTESGVPGFDAFCIDYHKDKGLPGPDFWSAVSIAVRIVARTYRVDVHEYKGFVQFNKSYRVTEGGHFKERVGDLDYRRVEMRGRDRNLFARLPTPGGLVADWYFTEKAPFFAVFVHDPVEGEEMRPWPVDEAGAEMSVAAVVAARP